MARLTKELGEVLAREGFYNKISGNHNAGQRIFPSSPPVKNAKYQVRLDAGEVKDGVKHVYVQPNRKAKNKAFKKFINKNSTHGIIDAFTVKKRRGRV
jgi:hypothetical protein